MADWEGIGKIALLLRGAWLAASLAVWGCIVWKLALTGRATVSRVERQGVSWPGVPVCATFLAALLAPAFLLALADLVVPELVPTLNQPAQALALIQWNLAMRVVQIAVIVGLLALAGPLRKQDFGCDLATWHADLAIGTEGFLASAAPVFGVLVIVALLGWRSPDDKHPMLQVAQAGVGVETLAWLALSVVVVAPLSEELTYRVLLQGWLQSQLPAWQAIVITAGVFVVGHAEFDRLPLVPLALILGYVYYRRNSYLSVVVLHALFNAANLAMAILQ